MAGDRAPSILRSVRDVRPAGHHIIVPLPPGVQTNNPIYACSFCVFITISLGGAMAVALSGDDWWP
jgi:hypothetical protein